MKTLFVASLIATALAAGFAQAESYSNVHAAGSPVRNGYGECWLAGSGMDRCMPQPVAAAATLPDEAARFEAPQARVYQAEVQFDFDGAQLSAEGRKVLDDLAQKLLQAELVGVVATAHADRLGGAHYNALLAARRAEAIRAYLVERGVPESVVQVSSRGAEEPRTGGRCDGLGEESRRNAKLVACLQPDRRVGIEAARR